MFPKGQPILPGLGVPGPGLSLHALPLPEKVPVTWSELGQEQEGSQSQQKELHGWKWPKVRLQVRGDGKTNGAGSGLSGWRSLCSAGPMSPARALSRPRLRPPRSRSPGSAATYSELARLLRSFGQRGVGGQATRSKVLLPALNRLHRGTARGRHARGTQRGRRDFTEVTAPAGEPTWRPRQRKSAQRLTLGLKVRHMV